jgi:hypothetical protein
MKQGSVSATISGREIAVRTMQGLATPPAIQATDVWAHSTVTVSTVLGTRSGTRTVTDFAKRDSGQTTTVACISDPARGIARPAQGRMRINVCPVCSML